MGDRQERNKRNAIAFYDLMFNESKPREAVDRFWKHVEFKRAFADGAM